MTIQQGSVDSLRISEVGDCVGTWDWGKGEVLEQMA